MPGFGLGGNGDKAILISADSIQAVLEDGAKPPRTSPRQPPPPPPPQAGGGDGQRSNEWASSTSLETLSVLTSSSGSESDESDFWDDSWVPDDNEAEQRQRWLEEEKAREAKHRRREAKQRKLDERWARLEKLNLEARDRRLAEEEEEKRISESASMMTRYGAKKNKTMIMIRSIVTRDGSSSSPATPHGEPSGSGIFGLARIRSEDQRRPTVSVATGGGGGGGEGGKDAPEKRKKERTKLERRRSGSEADLRRYADLLKPSETSLASSSSSEGRKAKEKSEKTKKKKKMQSEATHGPRLRRENTVGLIVEPPEADSRSS
jgi:hypothetical protein